MPKLFIGPIALAISMLPVAAIAQTTGASSQKAIGGADHAKFGGWNTGSARK